MSNAVVTMYSAELYRNLDFGQPLTFSALSTIRLSEIMKDWMSRHISTCDGLVFVDWTEYRVQLESEANADLRLVEAIEEDWAPDSGEAAHEYIQGMHKRELIQFAEHYPEYGPNELESSVTLICEGDGGWTVDSSLNAAEDSYDVQTMADEEACLVFGHSYYQPDKTLLREGVSMSKVEKLAADLAWISARNDFVTQVVQELHPRVRRVVGPGKEDEED